METWSTKEVVAAIIATGIVSAAASWCVDLLKSWYGRRQSARYSAIRCATALERYAVDCWHVFMMGKGEFHHHQNVTASKLPDPPSLSLDIDWKSLRPHLADEVLSFSNMTMISESLATYSQVWEGNPFDSHAAAKERGLEALKLAGRIRSAYVLPSVDGLNRIWPDLND